MTVFTSDEYKQRVLNTKKLMQERGMDLLLISQPANMNYLTGYDGWSFYVHQCVLVSLNQEEPVWIGRGMDANGARITSFLSEQNILEYEDDYVQSLVKHPMQFAADVIREKGWDKGTIGVEMDQFYFTHRSYVELEKSLPNARFLDANALVNWVRVVKSETEVEFMRRAGAISEKVMDAAVKNINVGIRECDAAAAVVQAQYSGTEKYGGDYPAIVPLIMAGEATKTPHLTWTDKEFQADEAVLLELAGVYKHYHAPIARTIFLGKTPPKLMRDTADTVLEGLDKTLGFIRAGITAEDVEAAWRKAIAHTGLVKESRLGYSIGLNYPPDWGEHTISLRPGDKTVLKTNMCLHLILGIWQDNAGFEVDASFRVTETGHEKFYDYPVDIFLK